MKRTIPLYDWDNDGGGCAGQGSPLPTIPAPLAPWQRPVVAPSNQVLTGDGTITLNSQLCLLQQTVARASGVYYNVTLPNGNYLNQFMTVSIPGSFKGGTFPFAVFGTFTAGWSSFLFNTSATFALFQWDGGGWNLSGGNAQGGNLSPVSP